jgi:hypothetical protein
LKRFTRNSSKSVGKSETISESNNPSGDVRLYLPDVRCDACDVRLSLINARRQCRHRTDRDFELSDFYFEPTQSSHRPVLNLRLPSEWQLQLSRLPHKTTSKEMGSIECSPCGHFLVAFRFLIASLCSPMEWCVIDSYCQYWIAIAQYREILHEWKAMFLQVKVSKRLCLQESICRREVEPIRRLRYMFGIHRQLFQDSMQYPREFASSMLLLNAIPPY